MTEKDEQNTAQPSGNSPPSQDVANAAPVRATKRHDIAEGFKSRTKGEGLFNKLTYTGVGYFGVTGFSVFLTWLIRDSKWLSHHYENFTEKLVQGMEKTPLRRMSGFVYSNMTIATLFLGGTIVSVLPVKWLEDNKSKIVKRFDRWLYGKEKVENDPEIKKAHAEMDAIPQQTWGSVTGSRVLAFGTTLGISLLMGSKESPLSKASGHSLDSVSARMGRGLDRFFNEKNPAANRAIDKARDISVEMRGQPTIMREWAGKHEGKHYDLTQGNGADRIPSRVYSYIFLDGFYTIFTSIALFVSTRILAPFLGKQNTAADAPKTGKASPAQETRDEAAAAGDTGKSNDKAPGNTITSLVGVERLQAAGSPALGANS